MPKTAEVFLTYLNNYQIDSLQMLITDSFQINRTYTSISHDKSTFINKYVPNSKNNNGKFNIIKSNTIGNVTEFLVEDQSDYLKYLDIEFPQWIIKIKVNEQNKVENMTIDTTKNYNDYMTQTKEMGNKFESWLTEKYPNETIEILFNTEGLLTQRLKEFSSK